MFKPVIPVFTQNSRAMAKVFTIFKGRYLNFKIEIKIYTNKLHSSLDWFRNFYERKRVSFRLYLGFYPVKLRLLRLFFP